uniref:Prephenate dehydratase domain-containing protein n=1 Tax=Arcella intermedia TaxID=1963864 RepID=A0A6B2KXB7_9EUKA
MGGSIHSNFDLLLRYSDLFIIGETKQHVQHCLVAAPGVGLKDVRKVISHPQALAQCDDYIRAKGLQQESYYDTAGSAKRISLRDAKDAHCAAIASRLAAAIYGLQVLDEGIQDDKSNYTRFIVLSTTPAIPPPPTPSKLSIVFALIDQPGVLYKALSVFTLRGMNMSKIESRPGRKHLWRNQNISFDNPKYRNSPILSLNEELRIIHQTAALELKETKSEQEFQTLFYLDVMASLNEVGTHNALRHLAEIAPFIRVLGCYPIGGAYVAHKSNEIYTPVARSLKSHKLKIGIIGFSRFGQFLCKNFLEDGHEVVVINLLETEDFTREAVLQGLSPKVNFFQHPSQIPRFFASNLDVVLYCTSVISFDTVLRQTLPYLTSQLVVDVLSVKKHPKTLLERYAPPSCDVLCTHPMFGPDSGAASWVGLPFIFEKIRVRDFHKMSRFLSFFEDKGCRMVQMSCEEHDRLASGTQFITHLTGRILSGLQLEGTQIDTVGFKTLLSLVKGTVRDSFDLFYGLYAHNEFSSQQLHLLEKAFFKVKEDLIAFDEAQKVRNQHNARDTLKDKVVWNARVEALAPSKTTKVTDLAAEMRQAGKNVITLSVGEPDFQPPQVVVDAVIEGMKKGETKYTPLAGTLQLRKAIANYLLKEKKIRYTPEEILCSCGAKQSILQVVLALCRPGDEVIVPAPYWVSYPEIVKLSGATPVVLPTTAKESFLVRPEQLRGSITKQTRMFILCNPSNPTGQVYTEEQLRGLVEVLLEFPHVYVLADEIYEKILFQGSHVSVASFPGMWERTLTINGFSKSHSMTGLRLGYLAAPKHIVAAAAKVQSHNTSCPPSVVQRAGVAALESTPPEYFKQAIEGFRGKRDLVLQELATVGVTPAVPQGAFYVFFDVSPFLSDALPTSEQLCLHLIEHFGVALVPGEAFGCPAHVRISYAIDLELLKEAMRRLVKGLLSSKHKSAL